MLSFIFSVLGYFFLFGAIAGLLQGEILTGSLFIPVAITLLIKSKHANKALAKILQKKEIPTKSGWLHLGVAFLFLMIAGATIPKDEIAVAAGVDSKKDSQVKPETQEKEDSQAIAKLPENIDAQKTASNETLRAPETEDEEVVVAKPNHAEKKKPDTKDRTTSAIVMCKLYVKNSLVSPSSADFPWPDEFRTWKREEQVYIIKSHVNSDNAYGVEVRSQWHCELKFIGGGKGDEFDPSNWELRVLEII